MVPSAVFSCVGVLPGYRLHFSKRSSDGSGKCNLERSEDRAELTYGVIFSVADAEVPGLDAAEDMLRGGYSRSEIEVEADGGLVAVEAYFANPPFIEYSLQPFDWYQALVLAGALEHGLPTQYCDEIGAIPSVRDPDQKRRERALATLGRFRPDFEAGRLKRR